MKCYLVLAYVWLLMQKSQTMPFKNNRIAVLKDLVLKQKVPLNIVSHLCWNKVEINKLAKMLFTINKSVRISSILAYPAREQYASFLLDLDCNSACAILKKAEQLNIFKQTIKWFVFGDILKFERCKVGLRVDTTFYLFEETSWRTYRISAAYAYKERSTNYVLKDVALWSQDKGFISFQDINFYVERRNLNGTMINVTYRFHHEEAINHIWDYRNKHSDATIFTFPFMAMYFVTDALNLTRNLTYSKTWGTYSTPTNATGFVGSLMNGEADMGGTPFYLIESRVIHVDFLSPMLPMFQKFIFKAPPLSYITNIFSLAFHRYVWYCMLALIAFTVIMVHLVVKWEWRDTKHGKKVEGTHNSIRPYLLESVMTQLSIITQQGSEFEMKSISGRIMMAFSLIAFMFLYTSYSANIVALLQSTTTKVNSLEDLLNSGIELGLEYFSFSMPYFLTTDDPIKKAIYEKIAPRGKDPNFFALEEGTHKMRTEFFAFHSVIQNIYEEIGRTFEESEKCSLMEVAYISVIEPYLPARKNWSYTQLVKISLYRMREGGIYRREQHKLLKEKPGCSSVQSNFVSAGFRDTYFPFLFLLLSYVLCVLLFVLELGIKRYY